MKLKKLRGVAFVLVFVLPSASVPGEGAATPCSYEQNLKGKLCRAMRTKEPEIRGCIRDREMIPRLVEKGVGS